MDPVHCQNYESLLLSGGQLARRLLFVVKQEQETYEVLSAADSHAIGGLSSISSRRKIGAKAPLCRKRSARGGPRKRRGMRHGSTYGHVRERRGAVCSLNGKGRPVPGECPRHGGWPPSPPTRAILILPIDFLELSKRTGSNSPAAHARLGVKKWRRPNRGSPDCPIPSAEWRPSPSKNVYFSSQRTYRTCQK